MLLTSITESGKLFHIRITLSEKKYLRRLYWTWSWNSLF